FYFDHLGTHGRSAVARIGRLKLAAPITSDGRALVSASRSQMAVAFNSLDPFRSEDFRNYFKRLCLQTSNAFSFDGLVKYRTQFEYLYDVLAAAPKDVGVIVTEHPYGEPVLKRSGPLRKHRGAPRDVFQSDFSRRVPSVRIALPIFGMSGG